MTTPALTLHKSGLMTETDTHVFFYGSPLSNWAYGRFYAPWLLGDRLGISEEWNCAEQYMMAHKAALFSDEASTGKICQSIDPELQKALGKKVAGYDDKKWAGISRTVVTVGCLHKFSQHWTHQNFLRDTGDKVIVEGSKYDPRWGVGVHWDDPAIADPANWQGTNWLGECLMNVRQTLFG